MFRRTIALCALAGFSSLSYAGVTPELVTGELDPGESIGVLKTVTLPEDTPRLDFLLIVDLTGSYGDDLPNIQGLAEGLATDIRASVPDSRFALTTFTDFPFIPWGYAGWGDYAYRLDQDFTTDIDTWVAAVNAMATRDGEDYPESQYEGLYQSVTGYGNDVNGDGDYTDTGDIPPGENPTFRPDATRVIAITTDAAFHEGGETGYGYPFPYPGATGADTLAALEDSGMKVIAIEVSSNSDPTYLAQMQDLADTTGGVVVTTDNTSSEIADAVLSGLEALTYTVSAEADADCALDLSWDPDAWPDVAGGESVFFDETIAVPAGISEAELDADGYAACSVDFLADDTVIGTELIRIHVPLNDPPVALCQDLYLVADDDCLAWGEIDAGSYDPDSDPLTYSYSDEGPWGAGTRTVTLTVTDPSGESDACDATVWVTDGSAPVVSVDGPVRLWPPDHKYVALDLVDCGVTVTDACDGEIDVLEVATITSAWSDELEDARGGGDGATLDDIVITGTATFDVRAERMGGRNGRVYGIAFEVDDGAGNLTAAQCRVTVPHADNGLLAIDDGPLYIVY